MQEELKKISSQIKAEALRIGFDACGIAQTGFMKEFDERLHNWTEKGFHAGMQYMVRNSDLRSNPSLIIETGKSAIVVLANYYNKIQNEEASSFKIARYAYGEDYHLYLKKMLKELLDKVIELLPGTNGRVFTDSAPVAERELAVKAGLGWMGKNNCLINKTTGSFTFIGEIIIDRELHYDLPYTKNFCGTCTKCIDSCPTGALVAPKLLDSGKCISYHTIENKDAMPDEIKAKSHNYIFGCDICQNVCPWNQNCDVTKNEKMTPSNIVNEIMNLNIFPKTEQEFKQKTKKTPFSRIMWDKFKDNCNL